MATSIWKGHPSFGLVSIPVKRAGQLNMLFKSSRCPKVPGPARICAQTAGSVLTFMRESAFEWEPDGLVLSACPARGLARMGVCAASGEKNGPAVHVEPIAPVGRNSPERPANFGFCPRQAQCGSPLRCGVRRSPCSASCRRRTRNQADTPNSGEKSSPTGVAPFAASRMAGAAFPALQPV